MFIIMNPEKKLLKVFKIYGDSERDKAEKKKLEWYDDYAKEN